MTLRAWIFIALLSAPGISAPAQNSDEAYNLAASGILDSGPRERAWAADVIASRQYEALYPRLRTALSNFQPNSSGQFEGTPEELALEVIAGAIIRAHVLVPARDARKLYPEFPALAMILLSRPLDDNRAELFSILNESKTGEVWLTAANLLALNPSPEFVIQQLDDLNVFTRILVSEPGTGAGMSYGDCGPSFDTSAKVEIPENWPPVSVYKLEVAKGDGTLVANGKNAVSFTSQVTLDPRPWKGRPDCGGPDIQVLRRDLIVQLSGGDSSSTALQAVVLREVVRATDDQYRGDAIRILQEQARSFGDLVSRLQSKGLITPAQAAERRLHMRVDIVRSRSVGPLPDLPDLRLLGIVGEYRQESF